MNVSFDGIGEVVATFTVKSTDISTLKPGHAVTFTNSGEVGFGTSTSAPCGVVFSVSEDGFAAVQVGGFARVPYTGTAPSTGRASFNLDGKGAISVASSGGVSLPVAAVDSTTQTAVVIL